MAAAGLLFPDAGRPRHVIHRIASVAILARARQQSADREAGNPASRMMRDA